MLLKACYFTVMILKSFLGYAHSEVIVSSSQSKNQRSILRKACEIPVFDDYYYLSLEGKKLDKEKCYDGSGKFAVKVVCFEDSQIILPDNFAVCFDGQWYPSRNTCVLKTCESVYDTYSTHYTCKTLKGVEVDCRLPAEPSTEITIRCAHWRYTFHNSRQNITAIKRFCQKSGEWQTWENCTPPCGLVSNNYTLFEENSNSSLKLVNEFPWSAAIYGYIDDEWKQLCVGTVISLIHVLTASDCVLGMKPGFLRVAFGKYFKNLSDYNQDRVHVVKYALNPPPYRLSILTVAEYIEFNDEVGTACLLGPGEVLDVKLQHFVTRGKDGNQSVITLNCQTSKQPRGNISSDDLLYCSSTSNHTFGPDELGGGLVLFHRNRAVLMAVLVGLDLDAQIQIFEDLGKRESLFSTKRLMEILDKSLAEKYKKFFIRRGDY